MTDESPPPTAPDPEPNPNPNPNPLIHPRRVSFEHGLLPIQKLVFTDPIQTLAPVKQKLTDAASNNRVGSAAIADILQISGDHASLVLETLGSVLHSESDPLVRAKPEEVDSVGADLRDLVLFLYIQSYKKLLPRTHKDSAAVADVWPSTSAFDGYLSALSPIQLVRSNSRRFMPSQADDEAHQLSYLQKHLANIISLLAEPVEGEGEDALVLSMEAFEHLGFLVQFGDKGSDVSPLSQATPFFANSDPDMPAVPVPASQVHDWLLQNIASALETITERISGKENGPSNASDQDDAMSDVSAAPNKVAPSGRGPCLIEGVSKTSLVKQASDLRGRSVKVVNCHDSVIYLLAPLRYATVYGCSDTTIVLGAVGKALRVEHCERVHVIAASKRVCIANCRECVFFLGVNQRPLIVGDNHKLQVAPYNTYYSHLEEHMSEVGVEPSINKWDKPLALGAVDPHDSLSHPAGVADAQAESAACVDPDQFINFLIPNWFSGEEIGSTKDNPFPLPDAYMAAQQRNLKNLEETRQSLRETPLEENRKKELSSALHVYFKDWLYASGNIRQLYCLQARSEMADSTRNLTGLGGQASKHEEEEEGEENDDYMGDLSQFIPPELTQKSKRKESEKKSVAVEASRKKLKNLPWHERRRLEKERKQIEEDAQTLARIEDTPIGESNVGFKLLKQMGYKPGSALGKGGSGRAEPVTVDIRRSRAGVGREDPHKEKRKREEVEKENEKRKVEEMLEDFGDRQKSQWRNKRVVINFRKAKAALDQLENVEVVPEKKKEGDEDGKADEEEEEEEEVITEEDLQEILMKLRDEHRYCPFCGFQYETSEALLSNCPGVNEDDH
ncbi:TBCC domain-containing protein 1 [Raphanus sativus]|nr:TBCC domain-containing protein 1 [Raphanus sativus]